MGGRNEVSGIGEEHPPPDEAAAIEGLEQFILEAMKQIDPHKRGSHTKGHGCVRAEFTVLEDGRQTASSHRLTIY
ncbi:MAG: hypothetical protein ACKVHE_10160 [Planctomycetales bacterium]|jgi:hypothetical protein